MTRARCFGALFVGLVLTAGSASAKPTREAVERLLAGYEAQPTVEDVKRLGEGVDHVLVAIAVDGKTRPIRRNRALAMLAVVPSGEGLELLRAVVHDNKNSKSGVELLDLRVAVRSLGAFGPDEAGDLLPLLVHPDADVRAGAAEALADAHVVAAVSSLRLRLSVERDGAVVQALRHAIASLSAQ